MPDPIRLAIIGAGLIVSKMHWLALAKLPDDFRIVALADLARAKAETLADSMPTGHASRPQVYTDYAQMLAIEKPQAVLVALPPALGPTAAEAAMAAGCHVITEKPIAVSLAQGSRMLSWAEKYNRVLMIAENYRYLPGYLRAAQLIAEGVIGRPAVARWSVYAYEGPDSPFYQAAWRQRPEHPGGYISDGGVHDAAALRMLLGEVELVTGQVTQIRPDMQPADTVSATLRFASGALGTYSSTYAVPGPETPLQVAGDAGVLLVWRDKVELWRQNQKVEEWPESARERGAVAMHQDFARAIVREGLNTLALDGKQVLILIPDGTRTMPMPTMFDLFEELLAPRAAAMDYLVALGMHQPMTDTQLGRLVGRTVINGQVQPSEGSKTFGRVTHVFNHEWNDPASLVTLGTIPASEISQVTNGLMSQDVPVTLNKRILDYDQIIICGPVFPHEVVGFSGGNKYFFPGIAGPDIINFTHWLGAVITSCKIIGAGYTPVRAVIDRAASFINRPAACFALVVTHEGPSAGQALAGLYLGSPQEAWQAASALSAQKHIVYVDKPFKRVLSIMPEMYDDLWTAAKGMYKMEPAVADGGEVVIYAPHITEVSYTHGKLIDEIGYHCRDYFLKQWDQFKRYPGGVLAHSTHVKGLGQYDAATGVESPRIQVTLATGIPAARCQRINLGYLDPKTIDLREWQGREEEGILVVPRAGEMLYRVK